VETTLAKGNLYARCEGENRPSTSRPAAGPRRPSGLPEVGARFAQQNTTESAIPLLGETPDARSKME